MVGVHLKLPEHFPSSLRRFSSAKSLESKPIPNEVSSSIRNPIHHLESALSHYLNGDLTSAMDEALKAKILAPGSPVLQLLPLLFTEHEPEALQSLYQIISSRSQNSEDSLDRILSQLAHAEKRGKLRIELSKEGHVENVMTYTEKQDGSAFTEADQNRLTKTDGQETDYSFVTPTYLAIFEQQEKYEEALELIAGVLKENPVKEELFGEIRDRLQKKLRSSL